MTDTATHPIKHRIEELRRELEGALGENRLQRHLLGMELHDRFDALERRHAELQVAIGKAAEDTIASLRQSITQLRASYDELRRIASEPA